MMRTFGGSTPEVVLAQAKLRDPQVDRADCRVAVPAADRPGPLLDVVFASVAVERYGGCDRGEGACVCSIRYGGRRGWGDDAIDAISCCRPCSASRA